LSSSPSERSNFRDTAAAFLADLANSAPVRALPIPDRANALLRFRDVLRRLAGSDSPIVDDIDARAGRSLLRNLGRLQREVQQIIAGLLPSALIAAVPAVPLGADVVLSATFRRRLRMNGRNIANDLAPVRGGDLSLALMDFVLGTPGRSPFWYCRGCRRVIVQKQRGKLPRYCASCKPKLIPSASRRSEYTRRRRRRRREEDLSKARESLRGIKKGERYVVLAAAFPGRPRKAINYLLRRLLERR
jgi:hypothetical protein